MNWLTVLSVAMESRGVNGKNLHHWKEPVGQVGGGKEGI